MRRPHDNPACGCQGCKDYDRPGLDQAEIIKKANLCVKLAWKLLPHGSDYAIEEKAMELLDKSIEEINQLLGAP